ncbi:hypothetical protein GQ457_06G017640 [Hibiscus cannabinus]
MTIEMKKKFDMYWFNLSEDDYVMLFTFAVILDPRFKLSFLKYCYEKLFEDETKAVMKVRDYDKEETMILDYKKAHLDVYYEDPKMDRKIEFDILNFWKENEQRYGRLSYLARDILSVPLTTVTTKSTFSIVGRILNKWRSSYIPENVEALITSRSWLFGYEFTGDDECLGSNVDWNSTKSNN